MSGELPTRREVLKTAAMVGATALAGQVLGQTTAPTTRSVPLVGCQLGAGPLVGDTDQLLDTMHNRCGMNALFLFAFGHELRFLVPARPANFRGGNYGIPTMKYYEGSGLSFDDLRAPEFPNADIVDISMKATHKHGMKTYAIIEEAEGEPPSAPWQAMYEYDFHGRRQRNPCSNNPAYRAFNLGLAEDYTRTYNIDGIMWSSERQGALAQALGAQHGGAGSDPSRATCFCEHCVKKGTAQGINVERAKLGFTELEKFVRDGRASKRPRDGYFVTFMRLLLKYPEMLQWEAFWINSRQDLMTDIRNRVKSANPSTPVGFHVWHNASFSPFYRAESDFAEMAKNADFIKPVLYNTIGGARMRTFVTSVGHTLFGDIPEPELLQMMYKILDYKEAPWDQLAAAGFSTDYITREIRRTLDDVAAAPVPIYAGLDIDIPGSGSPYTAETVKNSVMAAFKAGAQGVIFARNWGEMNPDHAAGCGDAVRELGLG
jgi:hypothetical protein